jgi:hypothetical protein
LTPIAQLQKATKEIEDSGAHSRGIVLWDAPDPTLAELRPIEEVEHEPAQVA